MFIKYKVDKIYQVNIYQAIFMSMKLFYSKN